MNIRMWVMTGLAALCVSLAFVALAALGHRAWWPELDGRTILALGAVVYGLVVWGLVSGQAPARPRIYMARRKPNPVVWFVGVCVATLVCVKLIQIWLVALGAG